jgi:uncharacterized protein (DUF1697 family)
MPRYVAFLRALNVGGHIIKMDHLRGHFDGLGFSKVETFIASGNVIFETNSQNVDNISAKIEGFLGKTLGYEVATFIRTDSEVAAIAQYRPFREADLKSAGAFCVGLLSGPLGREARQLLAQFKTEIDDFHAEGREVYWLCKKKQSESTFSNNSFERRLGIRTTFRGMNTIVRLAAKYPPPKK